MFVWKLGPEVCVLLATFQKFQERFSLNFKLSQLWQTTVLSAAVCVSVQYITNLYFPLTTEYFVPCWLADVFGWLAQTYTCNTRTPQIIWFWCVCFVIQFMMLVVGSGFYCSIQVIGCTITVRVILWYFDSVRYRELHGDKNLSPSPTIPVVPIPIQPLPH